MSPDVIGSVVIAVIEGGHRSSSLEPAFVAQDGTTEYVECSGRGLCDYTSGTCSCFDYFVSSDGLGGAGSRGDCGHFYWNMDSAQAGIFCPYSLNWDTNTSELCSGHGTCTAGACICDDGYGMSFVNTFFLLHLDFDTRYRRPRLLGKSMLFG